MGVIKRKIAVITGTRAEYGLLYYLMREIKKDADLDLQIIATGMHLSPEFGLTYQYIENDGFKIDAKVEMLISSDTAVGMAKSMGLAIISFVDVFEKLKPDVIVLLGDRFESLSVAQTALVQKIPIAHIHGGELSEGSFDDSFRHAITKMAHLHFVAAEPFRQRVIQLGENPKYVFNVGAPGLERIKRMKLIDRDKLEKKINFHLGKLAFLITYHPETLSEIDNEKVLQSLFDAMEYFPTAKIIFTKANADEAGRLINSKIDTFTSKNNHRAISFITLGELNYLSLLQFVDVVIGNSSSGIIEVPYFRKPTINIGNRQAKRLKAASIIDCPGEKIKIISAIKKALSTEFKKVLDHLVIPYTHDKTASKIKTILKDTNLNELLVKRFYDLSCI